MRVFKARTFHRSMRRSALSDLVLRDAVLEMAQGLAAKYLPALNDDQLDVANRAGELVEVKRDD